jgi:hypothetical protein
MDNLYIDSWSFFETGWEVLCYGGFVICTLTVCHFFKEDGKCYVMVDLYIDKWFWF